MVVPVLADYFRTMGGHILYGREFTGAEVQTNANVVVVNEQFASEFGVPADAVGREMTAGKLSLEDYRCRPADGLYGGWRKLFAGIRSSTLASFFHLRCAG